MQSCESEDELLDAIRRALAGMHEDPSGMVYDNSLGLWRTMGPHARFCIPLLVEALGDSNP
jgi:hypothetical protein